MKGINDNVFIIKLIQRINKGDFDVYLNLPFMSRDLFLSTIKTKLKEKILVGNKPILSDVEIKDCIAEVKETALNIIALYLKLEFIVRTETGIEFTEKGLKAIKSIS